MSSQNLNQVALTDNLRVLILTHASLMKKALPEINDKAPALGSAATGNARNGIWLEKAPVLFCTNI
jgi:hypothetical protein